jgi:hypothetical protein
VTDEALATLYEPIDEGYEGETITYTATVKDNKDETLPEAFIATLRINGTPLVNNQVFNSSVYDPETGLLTLQFDVPTDIELPPANYIVKLTWATQVIDVVPPSP